MGHQHASSSKPRCRCWEQNTHCPLPWPLWCAGVMCGLYRSPIHFMRTAARSLGIATATRCQPHHLLRAAVRRPGQAARRRLLNHAGPPLWCWCWCCCCCCCRCWAGDGAGAPACLCSTGAQSPLRTCLHSGMRRCARALSPPAEPRRSAIRRFPTTHPSLLASYCALQIIRSSAAIISASPVISALRQKASRSPSPLCSRSAPALDSLRRASILPA